MLEKSCATCLCGHEPTRRLVCIDCGDDLVNYVQSRSLADAEAEARIDVIGQNGNDGLHYSEPELADKPREAKDELDFLRNEIQRCYQILISEPDTQGALFKAENILRDLMALNAELRPTGAGLSRQVEP